MQKEIEKYRIVIYKEKDYVIMHTYESGYCELKDCNGWNFLLVPTAELCQETKETPVSNGLYLSPFCLRAATDVRLFHYN
jgi:hypothetical protein